MFIYIYISIYTERAQESTCQKAAVTYRTTENDCYVTMKNDHYVNAAFHFLRTNSLQTRSYHIILHTYITYTYVYIYIQ